MKEVLSTSDLTLAFGLCGASAGRMVRASDGRSDIYSGSRDVPASPVNSVQDGAAIQLNAGRLRGAARRQRAGVAAGFVTSIDPLSKASWGEAVGLFFGNSILS